MKNPTFGKTTDRFDHPDGRPSDILERHFHKGREVLTVHSQEENVVVEDKSQAYAVIAGGLEVLEPGKVSKVSFDVFADPETGELQRIVRRYEVGRVRR